MACGRLCFICFYTFYIYPPPSLHMFYYATRHCEKPHACSVKWTNSSIHIFYLAVINLFSPKNVYMTIIGLQRAGWTIWLFCFHESNAFIIHCYANCRPISVALTVLRWKPSSLLLQHAVNCKPQRKTGTTCVWGVASIHKAYTYRNTTSFLL